MKEAGYEWNEAKKELKKIEYKPTWSEENDSILNELIKYFESLLGCIATEERHKENRRWLNRLKFIKGRYTWKPSDTNTTSGTSNWPNYLKKDSYGI